MKTTLPALILACAILCDAALFGFAAGSIILSTGVSFFLGWTRGPAEAPAVTAVALVYQPTLLALPTHTPLPTYTPYPTPTSLVDVLQMAAPTDMANLDIGVTPVATQLPAFEGELVPYEVQPGDTLQIIAQSFAVTVDQIILTNRLDPANPVIRVGDILMIPLPVTTPAPAVAPPVSTPTQTPAILLASPTLPAANPTATPSPAANMYPAASATVAYPGLPTIYP